MFNVSTYNTTVNIKPACTGMLQKSHPKSFFKRFENGSLCAKWLFSEEPCLKREDKWKHWETYMNVVVLQVMAFGDNQFLCELINIEDLE